MSAEFKNVKSSETTLPERVADQLSQLIVDRKLTAEDKLPNEFELAEQLNVGRGTIREAVKLLVARNVLVIRRGKGTYIASNPGEVEDPFGFAFYPDQMTLARDLLNVRIRLEPWVARLAAERSTEADFALLREKCAQVEDDILSGRDHLTHDMDLHAAIAECTQDLVIPKLIPIITYSVRLFSSLNGNDLLAETIVDHRQIVDAICAHDPDAAERATLQHLEKNRAEISYVAEELSKETVEE